MPSFLSNLCLFAHAIVRTLFLCGLIPFIFLIYAAGAWARALRVPARIPSQVLVSLPRAKSVRAGTHPIGAQFGDERLRA